MSVPLLDVSLFVSGNPTEQCNFCDDLVRSFKRFGFVRLANHGIPDETLKELFAWSTKFFQLPVSQKQEIKHLGGSAPQRGWSCLGEERTAQLFRNGEGGEDMLDAREHFDQGSPLDQRWLNRWPDEEELPGFRSFMEYYYAVSHEIAQDIILRALEIGLKVERGLFTSKCEGQHSELRLNHYPEITVKELRKGSTSRIHPHTDLGVITCLFQDGVGGLETIDRETGEWVALQTASLSEMIVNISETFERWTNGQLGAGIHQVTIPNHLKHVTEETVVASRLSTAFFMKADREACVGALPAFVTGISPRRFENMTALEYHQKRLATAYISSTREEIAVQ